RRAGGPVGAKHLPTAEPQSRRQSRKCFALTQRRVYCPHVLWPDLASSLVPRTALRYLSRRRRCPMANRWSPEGALAHVLRTVLLAMLLPLASCATAYQPEQPTGGYTDFRLAANTYRVRFRGNNYTPRDKVELFLLYRCAQLTEQLGYDHFVLLSEDTLDISDPFAQAGIFPRNYHATALIQ